MNIWNIATVDGYTLSQGTAFSTAAQLTAEIILELKPGEILAVEHGTDADRAAFWLAWNACAGRAPLVLTFPR